MGISVGIVPLVIDPVQTSTHILHIKNIKYPTHIKHKKKDVEAAVNKLFPFRPAGISPTKFPRWQKLHKSLAICSNSLSNIDTALFYV